MPVAAGRQAAFEFKLRFLAARHAAVLSSKFGKIRDIGCQMGVNLVAHRHCRCSCLTTTNMLWFARSRAFFQGRRNWHASVWRTCTRSLLAWCLNHTPSAVAAGIAQVTVRRYVAHAEKLGLVQTGPPPTETQLVELISAPASANCRDGPSGTRGVCHPARHG
jgi:hypothetical protein